jgi:hypothetical protein
MTSITQADGKLLSALALAAVQRLGAETMIVDADDDVRVGWRLVRLGDVALVEKPADRRSPKRIDCYLTDADRGGPFKLDPKHVVFSLRSLHNATPPDFELILRSEPRHWLQPIVVILLGALNRHDPKAFARLRGRG